jgi:hypothetical protein
MPASPFYLDSTVFATATRIYVDVSMTTPALPGYYSDGVICRYWHFDVVLNDWVLDPFTYCDN